MGPFTALNTLLRAVGPFHLVDKNGIISLGQLLSHRTSVCDDIKMHIVSITCCSDVYNFVSDEIARPKFRYMGNSMHK